MKIKIRSKRVAQVVIALWIIFSIGYISYDQWNSYKEAALQRAYDSGIKNCVDSFLSEVKRSKCEPVRVFNSDNTEKVDVINIQCISFNEENE